MNNIIRIILISTVALVVSIAIIAGIIIFFKIRKIRKKMREEQNQIIKEISSNEGEIKMRQREDFGQPLEEVQNLLKNSINHETVEFCINSCIRNIYKNVLLLGDVQPYEAITISNKANNKIFVLVDQFNISLYKHIKEKITNINHEIELIESINENQIFDSIMVLNSTDNFDVYFKDYEKYLKEKGMFIVANTKANKKSTKELIKLIQEKKYRYDVLKWYTGFITIVK